MQTQGVSMAFINARTEQPEKKVDLSGKASFDHVFTKSSLKKSKTADKMDLPDNKKEIQSLLAEKKMSLEAKKNESSSEDILNMTQEAAISGVLHGAEQFLQDEFSMSEEDLADLLEMLGISLIEVLAPGEGDTYQLDETAFENLKQLLMEFHGLEDESAFLVNPDLVSELEQLKTGLESILNEQEFLSPKQFLEFIQEKLAMKDVEVHNGMDHEVPEDLQVAADTSKIQVTVEQEDSRNHNSGMKSDVSTETKTTLDLSNDNQSQLADAFAEKLNQAFRTAGSEQISSPSGSKADIVHQVVNHIRVRILPETTSMELSLHPESLGRVNISVSQSGGVTTATLLVQNEAAKEALESQIVTLKETFEAKGLKVESVEVMVSDFSFKKDDESKGSLSQEKKAVRRKMRIDGTEEVIEETKEETEEVVLDGRTIDYTA